MRSWNVGSREERPSATQQVHHIDKIKDYGNHTMALFRMAAVISTVMLLNKISTFVYFSGIGSINSPTQSEEMSSSAMLCSLLNDGY